MTNIDSSLNNTTQPSFLGKNLFFNAENGVVSLEDKNDIDIDIAYKLYIKFANNIKLEIKYPNLNRLKPLSPSVASLLGDDQLADQQASHSNIFGRYLKNVYVNAKPVEENLDQKHLRKSLCEIVLGIYPNFGFDPISKEFKIIVQGIVPEGPMSKQQFLKTGLCFWF